LSSRLAPLYKISPKAPAIRYLNVRKPTKALSRLSDNNENKPAPALPPDTLAAIGRELRRMYADIIAEGVPERFAEIPAQAG
jgi:Anti-sigma factor NepR